MSYNLHISRSGVIEALGVWKDPTTPVMLDFYDTLGTRFFLCTFHFHAANRICAVQNRWTHELDDWCFSILTRSFNGHKHFKLNLQRIILKSFLWIKIILHGSLSAKNEKIMLMCWDWTVQNFSPSIFRFPWKEFIFSIVNFH